MVELDAVILAAGLSRRMGRDKLLLPFGDTTILAAMLGAFPSQLFSRVIVVVSRPETREIAHTFSAEVVVNDQPKRGKSLSIQLGLGGTAPDHGVLFAVADQPLLTEETIARLVDAFHEDPHRIIVPEVAGHAANPVIFPPDLRGELLRLKGDQGGRLLLEQAAHRLHRVHCPSSAEFRDIDTEEDYQELIHQWMDQWMHH